MLKTAVFTICRLYKWVVMHVGHINAPTTFMQTINNLWSNMLDSSIAIFLNNILLYSHILKEHFTLLENILAYLQQFIFYCKLKKYSFLCNSTAFLGFDITPKGMCISDLKVQSLKKWFIPTTVK